MKKLLFSTILMLGVMCPCFAYGDFDGPPPPEKSFNGVPTEQEVAQNKKEMEKRKAEFDKRLNLTEAQKAKAKKLREDGQKQMKPIMDAMNAKRQELKAAKDANSSNEEIRKIYSDMKDLDRKAHQLRMSNMKNFEAILNQEQLAELNKMKEEGRKKFNEGHRDKPTPRFGINPPPPPPRDMK